MLFCLKWLYFIALSFLLFLCCFSKERRRQVSAIPKKAPQPKLQKIKERCGAQSIINAVFQ
jgi:hypothetical protein